MSKGRLAIQFFGHSRTYKKTYESFFKYIVEPNKADGWEVDIFIHTWDMTSYNGVSWHKNQNCFTERPLVDADIKDIEQTYNPKVLQVEHLEEGKHGQGASKTAGNIIRETYEEKNNIKYDYILYTRMDILFSSPFKISLYLDMYNDRAKYHLPGPLPEKVYFCGINIFMHNKVIDSRWYNEGDIIYFTNSSCDYGNLKTFSLIGLDYKLYRDFYLQRENFVHGWGRSLEYRLTVANNEISNLKTEKDKLSKILSEIQNSPEYIKQRLKNINLELKNKKLDLEIKALSKDFNIFINIEKNTAVDRIQNQLTYKLGRAIIENSKSIWGYMRMPYVLSYIAEQHANELKNRKEKLPKIETLADYKEALKYKEHLSYKLGEAFLKGRKTWYKGGLIKFYFEAKKLQREYKK